MEDTGTLVDGQMPRVGVAGLAGLDIVGRRAKRAVGVALADAKGGSPSVQDGGK